MTDIPKPKEKAAQASAKARTRRINRDKAGQRLDVAATSLRHGDIAKEGITDSEYQEIWAIKQRLEVLAKRLKADAVREGKRIAPFMP